MIDALLVVAAVVVTIGIVLGVITLAIHLKVEGKQIQRSTWRNEGL